MSERLYGGIVWTNHALERIDQRGLSQSLAYQAYRYPDSSYPGKKSGTTEYLKRIQNSTITVITTQSDKNETLVLSCWIDPPLFGTEDYHKKEQYKKYRKAGFWGKVFLTVRKQLGF